MHTTTLTALICFASRNCRLRNHTVFHDKLVAMSPTDGVRPGLRKMLAVCIPLFKLLQDCLIDLYEMEGLV